MEKIQKRLAEISEEIESQKKEVSILEGREKESIKNLKENLGVKTEEEAENKLDKMEKEQEVLEKSIRKDLKKLEEEYQW